MCKTWGVGRGLCDQRLCQRVQPQSPMGGQVAEAQMGQHPQTPTSDMALDNGTKADAWIKVLVESHMQQQVSK